METVTLAPTGTRLSIITPNYNHGHLIAGAIRSVSRQSRPVFEHIIVDDASTDDSIAILRRLERDHSHLRILTSEKNAGPIVACGRGLSAARGDLVMCLAADDVLLPEATAALLRVFDTNPDAALATGDVRFVSLSNGATWIRRYAATTEPRFFSSAAVVVHQQKSVSMINGAATIVRRGAAMRAGLNDARLHWHHDWFAFNVVAYRHGLWYVPQVVHEFRVSPGSQSFKSRNWTLQAQALDYLFGLLDSPNFADVRDCFRDSGVLSYLPRLPTYLLRRRMARAFATPRLIRNLLLIAGYRASSHIIPRPVLEVAVRLRGSLVTRGTLS